MPAPFSTRQPSRRTRKVTRFSGCACARGGGVLWLAALLVGSGTLCRAAWAQPPEEPSFSGRGTLSLQEQFQQLRTTLGALEVTQPEAAIARYQAFYEKRGFQDAQVVAGVTSVIAQLWWRELKNKGKALEIYDWAIGRLGQDAWAGRLRQEREQVSAGTLALSLAPVAAGGTGRAGEAEKNGALVDGVAALKAVEPASQTAFALMGQGAGQVVAIQAPFLAHKAVDIAPVNPLANKGQATGKGVLPLVVAPLQDGEPVVGVPHLASPASAKALLPVQGALPVIGSPDLSFPKAILTPGVVAPKDVATGARPGGEVFLVPGSSAAALKNIGQVNEKSLLATAVVAQIAGGALSAEQAWQNGSLTLEGVYDFFEHQVNPWGEMQGREGQNDDRLRLSMAGVLVNHGGERLKDVSKVPLPVRVWLADYFQNQGDARVLTWGESVLSELKAPKGEAQERMAFQAIERMGWFYRDQGQYEKGAQTWLRLTSLISSQSPSQPDALLEAARLYEQSGDASKAQLLYARVEQGSNTKMRGLAFYDQASLLVQEHPIQARDLILQKLLTIPEGEDRVGPLWVLAQAQWQLGAWSEARMMLEQIVQICSVPSPSNDQETVLVAARNRLRLLVQWTNRGFDLSDGNLQAWADDKGIYHAKLYVRSLEPKNIKARFIGEKGVFIGLNLTQQKRAESGILVSAYNLFWSSSLSLTDRLTSINVFIEGDNGSAKNVKIHLIKKRVN